MSVRASSRSRTGLVTGGGAAGGAGGSSSSESEDSDAELSLLSELLLLLLLRLVPFALFSDPFETSAVGVLARPKKRL